MNGGSKLVASATKVYLTKHIISHSGITPYHLQDKGRFGCLNGSFSQALDKFNANKLCVWAQHLPNVIIVCRVRFNCATSVSPYKAVFETNPVST